MEPVDPTATADENHTMEPADPTATADGRFAFSVIDTRLPQYCDVTAYLCAVSFAAAWGAFYYVAHFSF